MIQDVLTGRRSWWIECGDALAVLKTLPDACVQCCVTSPPYYGLRDYGTGRWEGGDSSCEHKGSNGQRLSKSVASVRGGGHSAAETGPAPFRQECPRCGAVRVDQQIGLEDTPDAYIARLVEVFAEVRRVLRDDGTLWLNVGDSYCTVPHGPVGANSEDPKWAKARLRTGENGQPNRQRIPIAGLKHKDMLGIPWQLAFALRADGWYLRSEIIWHKRAPMPESITDRPTKAHEQVFLLAKSQRYFFDQEAVREGLESALHAPGNHDPGKIQGTVEHQGGNSQFRDSTLRVWGTESGRNIRSVWTLGPESFADAHFATFPKKLVEPCVKAGTSEHGCCQKCGAAWRRVVERDGGDSEASERPKKTRGMDSGTSTLSLSGNGSKEWKDRGTSFETTGWRPCCKCDADPVPCILLDPFAGAGTSLLVARRLGRRALGIELNPAYAEMARKRVSQDAPLFNTEPTHA